jgi:hypothetical protein
VGRRVGYELAVVAGVSDVVSILIDLSRIIHEVAVVTGIAMLVGI